MGDIAKLQQQVTIGTLPDDVLLKIFKRFVDEMYGRYDETSEEWRTLVHICRRWRNLTFASPRHLNLQLLCRPPYRSVKEMLDIWPELPVYIKAFDHPKQKARDDVVAALKLNHRVSGIHFLKTSDSAWETFAPLMQQPFPALTHLRVHPDLRIENAISRSFLGDPLHLYAYSSCLAFHFRHYQNYFCLPPILSAFGITTFHLLGTFLLKE